MSFPANANAARSFRLAVAGFTIMLLFPTRTYASGPGGELIVYFVYGTPFVILHSATTLATSHLIPHRSKSFLISSFGAFIALALFLHPTGAWLDQRLFPIVVPLMASMASQASLILLPLSQLSLWRRVFTFVAGTWLLFWPASWLSVHAFTVVNSCAHHVLYLTTDNPKAKLRIAERVCSTLPGPYHGMETEEYRYVVSTYLSRFDRGEYSAATNLRVLASPLGYDSNVAAFFLSQLGSPDPSRRLAAIGYLDSPRIPDPRIVAERLKALYLTDADTPTKKAVLRALTHYMHNTLDDTMAAIIDDARSDSSMEYETHRYISVHERRHVPRPRPISTDRFSGLPRP